MSTFAVTAIGRDRPGIVAGISEALLDIEGNIEDSRMAILRGHFAVMLIVSVPDRHPEQELAERLDEVREGLGLEALTLSPVAELAEETHPGPTHVLSVYGSDHPGIVHAVSSALAGLGVNVCDLQTQVTGEGSDTIYVMLMEIALEHIDPEQARTALEQVATEAQVDVSLRELSDDAL